MSAGLVGLGVQMDLSYYVAMLEQKELGVMLLVVIAGHFRL